MWTFRKSKPEIVKFEDGNYAIRRTLPSAFYGKDVFEYKDIAAYLPNDFWWARNHFYFKDCIAGKWYPDVEKKLNDLCPSGIDYGKPVNCPRGR